MKKNRFVKQTVVFLFLGLLLVFPVKASEMNESIGMVTGSETGTYFRFGQEIAATAKKARLDMIVKSSEGSIANIKRITSKENAALAMVQSDVLGFLGRSDNPDTKRIAQKLRLIFPFYNEEVHLFARKEIAKFEDLRGRRVVIGTEGSGNWLTSHNLQSLMGVEDIRFVDNLKPDEAVTGVLLGEVDAMIYVAGKPVKLFSNLDKLKSDPKYAQMLGTVHFVPLNDPKMLQEYVSSEIRADDYGWFDQAIPTIAVKAVLISYDFSNSTDTYRVMRCRQLGRLGQVIRENIADLKQNGHPKWKEVNLEENVGIWKADSCSRSRVEGLKPAESKKALSEDLLRIIREK